MKKIWLTATLLSMITLQGYAQKYLTRTGKVSFFSSTPIENIEAVNNEAAAVLDIHTGGLAFIIPIKSFRFEKSLMQEHFNENYMESDIYPKAEFRGKIAAIRFPEKDTIAFAKENINTVMETLLKSMLEQDGSYLATVVGKMTIHGVTREVSIPGTLTVKGKDITAHATFIVQPADYKIKIPALVASKIAKEIEVTVNCILREP